MTIFRLFFQEYFKFSPAEAIQKPRDKVRKYDFPITWQWHVLSAEANPLLKLI